MLADLFKKKDVKRKASERKRLDQVEVFKGIVVTLGLMDKYSGEKYEHGLTTEMKKKYKPFQKLSSPSSLTGYKNYARECKKWLAEEGLEIVSIS